MESTPFILTFDKTGFPLIRHREWNFSISLFPVSKYQFERFLSSISPVSGLFSDQWYRKLLEKNPRCSWHNFDDQPWRLFLTGLEAEALPHYFSYCGRGCRLPEVDEWRALNRCADELEEFKDALMHGCAAAPGPIGRWLHQGLFPLTGEGLLEYVNDSGTIRVVGRPFTKLHPNLWRADTVRDISFGSKLAQLTGFRMVQEN